MGADQRQYPRTERRDPAEIEIARGESHADRIPVVIHSLSPEGSGFVAPTPMPRSIAPGTRVTVRLTKEQLELPGTVRWSKQRDDQWTWGGIELQLALAPAAARQRYAEWIVALLRRDLAS